MEANNISHDNRLSAKALEIAIGQLGQKENPVGSNSGVMVDEYLKSVGHKPGDPWCMAFVYWCYEQAAKALTVNNPVLHTAGVHDCWDHTATTKKFFRIELISRPELVTPGSQGILLLTPTKGHTFIIVKVEGMVIHTVEGNSNTDGSSEGYEVVRHQRRLDDKGFVGIIKY